MIPIFKITIETEKTNNEIFDAIIEHAYLVQNIWFVSSNKLTGIQKPLIGQINDKKSKLSLTRCRTNVESMLPKLIVKGKLISKDDKKALVLTYIPGLLTTFIFILLIVATGFIIWNSIGSSSDELLSGTIPKIVAFPFIAAILTIWEYIKTEDKIFTLLELKNIP